MKCWYAILVLLLIVIFPVSAYSIEFIDPTPPNNSVNTTGYIDINISVNDTLNSFVLNWSGANYSFYDQNLILAMNFENNSEIGENNTHITDNSLNGNNGTWWGSNDINLTAGKFGNAINFDGINDNISLPTSLNGYSDNLSIELWINIPSNQNTKNIIQLGNVNWGAYIRPTITKVGFSVVTTIPSTTQYDIYTSSDLNYGEWYHVVATFDNSTGTIKIYLNGILEGTQSTGAKLRSGSGISWIGSASTSNYFNGSVDELRIYNRTLLTEEVEKHYLSELRQKNSTNWYFKTNLSIYVGQNYSYYGAIVNQSGYGNSTEIRFINSTVEAPLCNALISYDSSLNYVNINGTSGQEVTWACIEQKVNNASVFNDLGDGSYLSNSTRLWFRGNLALISNSSEHLKLNNASSILFAGYNITLTNGSKITSWNVTTNNVVSYYVGTTRGSVRIDNPARNILISDANLSYLGDLDSGARQGVFLFYLDNAVHNMVIIQNTSFISNYDGFFTQRSSDIIFKNNTIKDAFRYGIVGFNSETTMMKNYSIQNNTIINSGYTGVLFSGGKYLDNATFDSNNVTDSLWRNIDLTKVSNFTIQNDLNSKTDQGIYLNNVTDIIINNVTIVNITKDTDLYNVGVFIFDNSSNVSILNSNMVDVGHGVISMKNNSNITIQNTDIQIYDINNLFSDTTVTGLNEPFAALMFVETYKGWLSDASEVVKDNRTKITNYKTHNVTVSGLTTNAQIILMIDGVDGLSHDLTNYWLLNYSFPRLTDPTQMYISNSNQTVTTISSPVHRGSDPLYNWSVIRYPGNLTNRVINSILQKMFMGQNRSTSPKEQVEEVFFDYSLINGQLYINPQGTISWTTNGSTISDNEMPYDFYLYSPVFTPFSSKSSTIFSNGTTYIQIYNDILEPNGYHTLNLTAVPTSDSVIMNVTQYNSSTFNFTANSTNGNNVQFSAGNRIPLKMYSIKKDDDILTFIPGDANGYINFSNSLWSEHTFTSEEASGDWWNSITEDTSLFIHPAVSESISTMLLYDNINTTIWTLDGNLINESDYEYTTSFSSPGTHTITAQSNLSGGGVTANITWYLTVLRPKSDPGDVSSGMNTTWFDDLLNTISGASPDFIAFMQTLIMPFTNNMGDLFYVFPYLLPLAIIWLRQEKAIIPVGLGIIFGGLLLPFLPATMIGPAILMIIITVVGILYSLWKERQ